MRNIKLPHYLFGLEVEGDFMDIKIENHFAGTKQFSNQSVSV